MTQAMGSLMRGAIVLLVCAAIVGCPGNAPVRIEVSPNSLDYGQTTETLTIQVTKSRTNRVMSPLVVSGSADWITVLDCFNSIQGCVSNGPLDPINVRVSVDRSLMRVGDNRGTVIASSAGAVAQTVDISVFTAVAPSFTASTQTPFTGEIVSFTNTTTIEPGWSVANANYIWDFGDGNTFTGAIPPPHVYSESGDFTVSLRATAQLGTARSTVTATRENFMGVSPRIAPDARFTASQSSPLVGNPVFFTDTTDPGSAPIDTWDWTFGDGGTSTEQNPTHTFLAEGSFDVVLTVTTAHGTDNFQRTLDVIITPPTASFSADVTTTPVNISPVRFMDQSDSGSADIIRWAWDFGDGNQLEGPNPGESVQRFREPVYTYTDPGVYSVSLMVTTAHGNSTSSRTDYITAITLPPTAEFSASSRRPFNGEAVQFFDQSTSGTAPPKPDPGAPIIDSWMWDFGDPASGLQNISSLQNPIHTYSGQGMYTVTLTVTTAHGSDTLANENFIGVHLPTALDAYVRTPEPAFRFDVVNTINDPRFTAFVVDLTSLTWRGLLEVAPREWNHWMTIIVPTTLNSTTGLFFVEGGSNSDGAPTTVDSALGDLAFATGTVISSITIVPNQPLTFPGDDLSPRSENALLAQSFVRAMDAFDSGSPDPEWAALFPMTKAAVAGLDVTQEVVRTATGGRQILDFVVAGASKRGWTTWLTAATDQRVKAVAPFVFDALNFSKQLQHHFNVYGFFAEAIYDYVEAGLIGADTSSISGYFSRFDSAAGQALLGDIDPYSYRTRFDALPKLLINSTGDQFFLPDSAQFYFNQNDALQPAGFPQPIVVDGLTGEKKLAYIPNTGHSLSSEAFTTFTSWYIGLVADEPLPQIEWELTAPGVLVVRTSEPVRSARVWTSGSDLRDYRNDVDVIQSPIPAFWSSAALQPDANGDLVARVSADSSRWLAFFVEVEFKNRAGDLGVLFPYKFSTQVYVTPDTLPVHDFELPVANFTSEPIDLLTLQFMDTSQPGSGPVIRWLWDFGDGNVDRTADPSHVFAAPGTYTVSLTATTVHGSDTTTQVITVS